MECHRTIVRFRDRPKRSWLTPIGAVADRPLFMSLQFASLAAFLLHGLAGTTAKLAEIGENSR